MSASLTTVSGLLEGMGLLAILKEVGTEDVILFPTGTMTVRQHGRDDFREVTRADVLALGNALRALSSREEGSVVSGGLSNLRVRFSVVLPPVSRAGASVAFRPAARRELDLEDLVEAGMVTKEVAEQLVEAVVAGRLVVVFGGSSAGKTTLSKALLRHALAVHPTFNAIAIDDGTGEIQGLPRTHVWSAVEGTSYQELMAAALRFSAAGVFIAEVRLQEAGLLVRWLQVGHSGGITTMHGAAADDVVRQLLQGAKSAGVEDAGRVLQAHMPVLVNVKRKANGERVVVECLWDYLIQENPR